MAKKKDTLARISHSHGLWVAFDGWNRVHLARDGFGF